MKRKVLVTGGSRGIGAAIARRLAADGFEVWINYRQGHDAARATQAAIEAAGGTATLLPFDVADAAAAERVLLPALEKDGPLFGLVNNAGIARDGLFVFSRPEEWSDVLATSLNAFYNVTRPVLRAMLRPREGRIVTISSVSGQMGNRGQVNYSAAKAALIGATRALAKETARQNILVNAVAPGVIETDMAAGVPKEVLDAIPLRRFGTPEEVAGVVSFLFSPDAAYVTGEVIAVNGGLFTG
jgi:3-oxoacyl-[acyl-carrier protein] reductase